MNTSKLAIALVAAAALWALACGGTSSTAAQDDGGNIIPDLGRELIISLDVPDGRDGTVDDVPEAADPLGIDGETGTADADDVRPDGVVGPDAPPDCPGGALCPCTRNEDCYSGYCLESQDGFQCALFCTTDAICPDGWACGAIVPPPDPTYGCIYPYPLCRPCKADADCAGTLAGRNLCIDLGPEGSVCGTFCGAGRACPAGYECQAVQTPDGPVDQCRPAGGAACPCTTRFVQQGYTTTCYVENGDGRCAAERRCDQACTAATPAPETCNGIDDNCDGQTDEGTSGQGCTVNNRYGSCPGTTTCVAGIPGCEGAQAAQETCNNLDDNCNGQTDEQDAVGCASFYRDEDLDTYGVPGDAKCLCAAAAPYSALTDGDCRDDDGGVHPGAAEVCNGKDDNCNGQTDEGTAVECFPTVCDSTLGACKPTCAGAGDCQAGYECTAEGACRKVKGSACGAGEECASGFCADQVCCDAACAGLCERCNAPGRVGSCDPVPADADPDNECEGAAATTCGLTGSCDGKRACALHALGTVCVASTCDDLGTSHRPWVCDGAGTCTDAGSESCLPYVCAAESGLCLKRCSGDGDCDPGYACAGGTCKRAKGQGCSGDGECATGFCVDGLCCESRCDGTCERCDAPGRLGTCDPIAAGADPAEECAASDASTCGLEGGCSGQRTCARWTSGTVCAAAACVDAGHAAAADRCDGAGACLDGGTADCAPYRCSAGACLKRCAGDGDCLDGYACSAGFCLLARGAECRVDAECATGFCTDGFCCENRCGGACEACNQGARTGFCDALPAGTGDAACPGQAPATCGHTGLCAGNRTCAWQPAGTSCAGAVCVSPVASTRARSCDGAGTCADAGVQDCRPYACSAATGQCLASCVTSSDCQSGFVCTGEGRCLAGPGATCGSDGDCASGFCTDHVCCDTRCAGTCQRCDLPGSPGFCSPVPAGSDPDNECPTDAASTCGRTGVCSGQSSCALYTTGSICEAGRCLDTATYQFARTCDGAGTCKAPVSQGCTPFTCQGSGCGSVCTVPADCQAGYECVSGSCRLAAGQPCSSDLQCGSGYCTDGMCCKTRCFGTCERCGGPGNCDALAAGTDPDSECTPTDPATCGTTGVCSGARSCQLYPGTQTCKAARCATASQSELAWNCNGSGTCTASGSQDCAPYGCNAGTGLCRTSCTQDGDCINGYVCQVGTGKCMKADGQSCNSGVECIHGACCNNTCRDTSNDTANCGGCGVACTNPNGTTSCSGSKCQPACDLYFGDCNGNVNDGCESSLSSTIASSSISNCASCGATCSRTFGTVTCPAGSGCTLASCLNGHATCDGNTANGCERDLTAYANACLSATDLGSKNGDRACGFLCPSSDWSQFAAGYQTGYGSKWFKARITETSTCCSDLHGRVTLTPPADADYDLFVYHACGGAVWLSSVRGAGQVDQVEVTGTDSCDTGNDPFDFWIEVRFLTGTSCGTWTLRVEGTDC